MAHDTRATVRMPASLSAELRHIRRILARHGIRVSLSEILRAAMRRGAREILDSLSSAGAR